MNDLPQKAFSRASALPTDGQERFARFLLAELGSEQKWSELFSRPESGELLDRLADEALSDHRTGRTRLLDPDEGCSWVEIAASAGTPSPLRATPP